MKVALLGLPQDKKEGVDIELIRFAFTGVNVIPSVLLILTQVYWLITLVGFMDFDFLDLDVDLDADVPSGASLLGSLAVLINVGQVPIALVLSLLALNFWIVMMLTYFLPITAGGLISGLLLVPSFVAGIFITKYEIMPLKLIFKDTPRSRHIEASIIDHYCMLKGDLVYGKLGQGVVRDDQVSLVINVKTLYKNESFKKNEVVFIAKKDQEKDVYYITKTIMNEYYHS